MRDDQYGQTTFARQFGYQLHRLATALPIQRRGGFVGQQKIWIANQRTSNRDPLALTAGEFGWPQMQAMAETNGAQHSCRSPHTIRFAHRRIALHRHRHILNCGQKIQQSVILKNKADPTSNGDG